jgi:hypothetical protein
VTAGEAGLPTVGHVAGVVEDAVRVAAGAPDLSALFRSHHVELVRLAVLLVRSREAGEDIVQDVFTRVHARRGGGPDADGAVAYLRQAVINGCRSWQRRQAVARRSGALGDRAGVASHESAEYEVIRPRLGAGCWPSWRRCHPGSASGSGGPRAARDAHGAIRDRQRGPIHCVRMGARWQDPASCHSWPVRLRRTSGDRLVAGRHCSSTWLREISSPLGEADFVMSP